jgi:hypothetical protein
MTVSDKGSSLLQLAAKGCVVPDVSNQGKGSIKRGRFLSTKLDRWLDGNWSFPELRTCQSLKKRECFEYTEGVWFDSAKNHNLKLKNIKTKYFKFKAESNSQFSSLKHSLYINNDLKESIMQKITLGWKIFGQNYLLKFECLKPTKIYIKNSKNQGSKTMLILVYSQRLCRFNQFS